MTSHETERREIFSSDIVFRVAVDAYISLVPIGQARPISIHFLVPIGQARPIGMAVKI